MAKKKENKPGMMLVLFAVLAFGVLVVVLLSLGDGRDSAPSYASLGGEGKEQSTLSDAGLESDEIGEFILRYVPPIVEPEPEPVSNPYPRTETEEADRLEEEIREVFEKETVEETVVSNWTPPTDEEVFHRLFPDSYLDSLSSYQDELINMGYLSSEDRLTFDSLDNMLEGLDRGLDYLLDTGVVTQERYDRLRIGMYGEFKSLIMYEWEQLKTEDGLYDMSKMEGSAFNIRDFWPPRLLSLSAQSSCGEEEGLFKKLWRKIAGFLSSEPVYAAGCGADAYGGVCIEAVECYRFAPPVPGGVNLWAPCCCCCAGKTPIGCLNLVCDGPRAAIWDPMTGICGCG